MFDQNRVPAVCAASLLLGAPAVFAQSVGGETGGTLEEVLVTAQKRTESVQDVPISVTVVSADQIARQGIQSVQDFSQTSASLEFTSPGASPGGGGFVRGIGTQSLGAFTAASSVSIVLDGVVLGNTNITDVFDLERVEILKGPQGTLFGSSVSAGVVSLTTKAPDPSAKSASVSGEYALKDLGAEYSRSVVRAAVNLPLGDESAVRIAAHGYGDSGFSDNVFTGAESDSTSRGVRARYLVNLTDDLTLNLIGDYNSSRAVDGAGLVSGLVYRVAPAGTPLETALTACGVRASEDNTDNCSDLPRRAESTDRGVSLQLDWTLPSEQTLTSITSYRERDQESFNDVIGIPPSITRAVFGGNCNFGPPFFCSPTVSVQSGVAPNEQTSARELFTQELRIASPASQQFEWVAGLYFQKGTLDHAQPGRVVVHPTLLGRDFDIVVSNYTTLVDTETVDYAAFANATYFLTPQTRLIAGARYTDSEISEDMVSPPNTGTAVNSLTVSDEEFTWRAGVQHDFGDNAMVYVTVATGYKAPQINDNLSVSPRLIAIKAERPISYELGIKQSLFGNRLGANANVFYTEVKDYQSQSCIPDAAAGVVCTNINVPEVVTKGVELDLFGRPFEGATINLSGIYNIAEYPTGFRGADASDLSGRQLNYAPKYKVTLSAEQEMPLNDTYALVVGADATFRDEQSMYLSSLPQYTVDSQVLYNARLGLKSQSDWSVYLFGRNLSNEVYPSLLFPTQAFHPGGMWHVLTPNSRRLVGLQFEANF